MLITKAHKNLYEYFIKFSKYYLLFLIHIKWEKMLETLNEREGERGKNICLRSSNLFE